MATSGREGKPRKLDEGEEILSYLISLDAQLTSEGTESVDLEVLVENVLNETASRLASVASDRRTNLVVEKIVLISSLAQSCKVLQHFSPYAIFLSTNRYSSHVLQALFSRLCYLLKSEGIHESNEDALLTATSNFMEPIIREAVWLSKDISASHVVRGCISILAGIPVVSERKGKASKHKHSISLSMPLDSMIPSGKLHIDSSLGFLVPYTFHESLKQLAALFASQSSAELHPLLADSSSCAVLSLLLRVLFCDGLVEGGSEVAMHMVKVALEWVDKEEEGREREEEDEQGGEREGKASDRQDDMGKSAFYAMAGDRSGSYFLQVAVETLPDVDFLVKLLGNALTGVVYEYATDGVGNFVIQSVLKRLAFEAEKIPTQAFGANSVDQDGDGKKKKKKLKLLKMQKGSPFLFLCRSLVLEIAYGAEREDADQIASDVSDKFAQLVKSRGGVILWLLSLLKSLQQIAEYDFSELVRNVANAVLSSWADCSGVDVTDGGGPSAAELDALFASRLARSEASTRSSGAVDAITAVSKKEAQIERDTAQLLFARQVGEMLNLGGEIPASLAVLQSLSRQSVSVVANMAMNGQMSRVLIDKFFADNIGAEDLDRLLDTLVLLVPELGMHYVGQHVLRQAFETAGAERKESIVQAAVSVRDHFSRTKEGRNTLQLVHADLYIRDPHLWKQQARRQSKAREWDILRKPSLPSASVIVVPVRHDSRSDRATDVDAFGEDEGEGADTAPNPAPGARKRKRKRPSKGPQPTGSDPPSSSVAVRRFPVQLDVDIKNRLDATSSSLTTAAAVTKDIESIFSRASAPLKEEAMRNDFKHQGNAVFNQRRKEEGIKYKVSKAGAKGAVSADKGKADFKKIQNLRSSKLLSSAQLDMEIQSLAKEKSSK